MWDYEKTSVVIYPFYFINWQSIHKTSCMQGIKKILMWEVLPAIALKTMILTVIVLFSHVATRVGVQWTLPFWKYMNLKVHEYGWHNVIAVRNVFANKHIGEMISLVRNTFRK